MNNAPDIPQTYIAENTLLGALVENSHYIRDARKLITPECFADDKNRALWGVLCEKDDAGQEVSLQTIVSEVNLQHFQSCILERCQPYTLGELADLTRSLFQLSYKRKAYFVAHDLLNLASGKGSADDIFARAQAFVQESSKQMQNTNAKRVDAVMNELGDVIQERLRNTEAGKRTRIPTSFPSLDQITYGGFAQGNLVVLAARPSIGKTAFMLQMARAAAEAGIPAMVFSLEMTNIELAQRMLNSTTYVKQSELITGRVNWQHFEMACGKFADAPLWFNDRLHGFDEICHEISTAHKQGKCDIAFIDYLGLIQTSDTRASLYQQVTAMTKKLKALAKDCALPIVLLCQLNRDMSKEGRAPELHDLRDSGSIEQDADIVLMLQRPMDSQDEYEKRRTTLWVRKNRQGRVGPIETLMDETFTNIIEQN